MCFDAFCYPMNPLPEDEGKPFLKRDVIDFVRKVERAFDLPEGTLTAKVARPVRKYQDHSLSEIRTAIIIHLYHGRKGIKQTLADGLGVTMASVLYALERGTARLDVQDREFMVYYEVIQKIK